MALLALGGLVLALERVAGERVVVELVAPTERLEAEDVLVLALVVGVAQLARLRHRLATGVHALALLLPLADGLVAGQALVVGQVAAADVAVLAMVLAVDIGVGLGKRA